MGNELNINIALHSRINHFQNSSSGKPANKESEGVYITVGKENPKLED
jgi:hypothetical protein